MITDTSRRRFLFHGSAALGSLCWMGRSARALDAGLDDAEAFLAAVLRGDGAEVRALLGTQPLLARLRDERGVSAFLLAHWHGHAEIAGLLHGTGLELDFFEAAVAADWERCEELVEDDPAVVGRASALGGDALYLMARLGHPNMWRLQSLGCDPNRGAEGGAPAVRGALECEDPRLALVSATDLLGNGGDASVVLAKGDGLLHVAARRGTASLLRLLLRKGADPSRRNAAGQTPLDVARHAGAAEAVAILEEPDQVPRDHRASRFLDREGAPVSMPELGELPESRRLEIVGAAHTRLPRVQEIVAEDPRYAFSVSRQDELAVEAGAHMGNRAIVEALLEHGAPQSLPTSITLGDNEAVRARLEEDPELVRERGAHDFAVMWYPCIGDNPEAAELLLDHGADVDQQSKGTTALHWAVLRDRLPLAELLVDAGADLHAVSRMFERTEGQTPRQLAEARNRTAMARFLRERGG